MNETKSASLRLTPDEKKALKKEAGKQFRTLAAYLKMLVVTHPEIQSKKIFK